MHKVIIVDDDAPVRAALGLFLKASGFTTQGYPSGDALLEALLGRTTDDGLRSNAASALRGAVAQSDARDALLKTFLDATTDDWVRRAAASALAGAARAVRLMQPLAAAA